jgi:hypothetical protein
MVRITKKDERKKGRRRRRRSRLHVYSPTAILRIFHSDAMV